MWTGFAAAPLVVGLATFVRPLPHEERFVLAALSLVASAPWPP